MRHFSKIAVVVSFFVAAYGEPDPYDDGKYKKMKIESYDDGKYYRPRTEGKYVPGDEGKYTYIYTKGVWPYDGTYKHLEVGDNEYAIYAPRFPYTYGIIGALTNTFESPDILTLGEYGNGVPNYFGKFQAQQENKSKSQYVEEKKKPNPNPNADAINQYFPPTLKVKEGEKLGTVYNYKGTKVLSTVEDNKPNKLKLEYEVFVRIVDELNKK